MARKIVDVRIWYQENAWRGRAASGRGWGRLSSRSQSPTSHATSLPLPGFTQQAPTLKPPPFIFSSLPRLN